MGIGKNKIYELINNNKIEYVNFAGKYRISEKGIQGYLEQNTKKLDNSVVFSKVWGQWHQSPEKMIASAKYEEKFDDKRRFINGWTDIWNTTRIREYDSTEKLEREDRLSYKE